MEFRRHPDLKQGKNAPEHTSPYAEQVRVHAHETRLSPEKRELIETLKQELNACVAHWALEMDRILAEEPRISPKIREYLEKMRYDLPTFDIFAQSSASAFFNEHGDDFSFHPLSASQPSDSLLVVFNLPRPLDKFWWKGGAEHGDPKTVDVRNMVIEWGRVYRKIMPVIWRATDDSSLLLNRLNFYGVHKPGKFYYVWEAVPAPLEPPNTFAETIRRPRAITKSPLENNDLM